MNCTMLCAIFLILFFNSSLVKSYNTLEGKKVKDISEFPFLASIRTVSDKTHVGAAVIISEKYLLTAAYWFCGIKSFDYKYAYIYANSVDLDEVGINYEIDNVVCEKTNGNIALVKLKVCIDFTGKVKPVKIFTSEIPSNALLTLVGWGASCDGGEGFCGDPDIDESEEVTPAKLLEMASVQMMDIDECNVMYKAMKSKVKPESELCTDKDPETNGPCVEDIGGPILHSGSLLGIYVTYPCRPNYPEVYAKVGYYLDWIRQYTNVTVA